MVLTLALKPAPRNCTTVLKAFDAANQQCPNVKCIFIRSDLYFTHFTRNRCTDEEKKAYSTT